MTKSVRDKLSGNKDSQGEYRKISSQYPQRHSLTYSYENYYSENIIQKQKDQHNYS